MTFAATSFAETSFCADNLYAFDVVGSFPIFPFNGEVITLVMSLNFETEFSLNVAQEFAHNLLINTGIDTIGLINTTCDYPLKMNTTTEHRLVR